MSKEADPPNPSEEGNKPPVSHPLNREWCQHFSTEIRKENPWIEVLLRAMAVRGCVVNEEKFYQCVPCEKGKTSEFDTEKGVLLCENQHRRKHELQEDMIKQTIHAFDFCRMDFNPRNCLHIACTEIRGENLSGNCLWMNQVKKNNRAFVAWKEGQQECVKKRVEETLSSIPHCKARAHEYIQAAFNSCYHDLEPFDAVPP